MRLEIKLYTKTSFCDPGFPRVVVDVPPNTYTVSFWEVLGGVLVGEHAGEDGLVPGFLVRLSACPVFD